MLNKQVYQIMDVNFNRIREGLRIIEEILRFILRDKSLFDKTKKLRQKIGKIEKECFKKSFIYNVRNVKDDLGKDVYTKQEKTRQNLKELIKINFKRAEEGTRVLEEFSKIINPKLGKEIKEIRFDIYSLEGEIEQKTREIFKISGLYVILDSKIIGIDNILKAAKEVISGGAKIIQLRDKESSTRKIIDIGFKLRKVTKDKVKFIINDRVDIAAILDADGVHIGEEDVPLEFARKILGLNKIIGFSADNFSKCLLAERQGADYVAVGPIFKTQTKLDAGKPLGASIISKIKEKIKIPLVVIGGINEDNLQQVIKADAFAVASSILLSDDIEKTTRRISKRIEEIKKNDKKIFN